MQEVTTALPNQESVEEDVQMMPCKKIPLRRTPTKTAAFAVLDEFRNIIKPGLSQLYGGRSVKNGSDIEREEVGSYDAVLMCSNGTNRDTHLNIVCCHDLMPYKNQVSNHKVLTLILTVRNVKNYPRFSLLFPTYRTAASPRKPFLGTKDLIADSLCYDDPTVKVDSVKEHVLLFYTHVILYYIGYIYTYCHIRFRISAY